jgi:glycosyltransferase involved in cell wall biosynthesis
MLTVLIETKNSEEGLARTLASLVPGAIEGVVREVIVRDLGSTDQTRRVAEHAGCHLLTGELSAAIAQAKGAWLLVLEPGARLAEGWIEPVLMHAERQTMAARFSRARAARAPLFSRIFSRRRALAHGLLIGKGQAVSLSSEVRGAEEMAGRVSAKRLPAEIFVAQFPPT